MHIFAYCRENNNKWTPNFIVLPVTIESDKCNKIILVMFW